MWEAVKCCTIHLGAQSVNLPAQLIFLGISFFRKNLSIWFIVGHVEIQACEQIFSWNCFLDLPFKASFFKSSRVLHQILDSYMSSCKSTSSSSTALARVLKLKLVMYAKRVQDKRQHYFSCMKWQMILTSLDYFFYLIHYVLYMDT